MVVPRMVSSLSHHSSGVRRLPPALAGAYASSGLSARTSLTSAFSRSVTNALMDKHYIVKQGSLIQSLLNEETIVAAQLG